MKRFVKNGTRALALVLVLACTLCYAPSSARYAFAKKKSGVVKSVKITNAKKVKKLYKGRKATLKVKVTVKGKVSKKVKYTSSNKNVATVSAKGLIKAKKIGTTKITVTSVANKRKKASVTVKVVRVPIKSAVFQNAVLIFEKEDETLASPFTLALGQSDDDGTVYKLITNPTSYKASDFTWSSSNPSAVSVSAKGKIKVSSYCDNGVEITAKAKSDATVVASVTLYCYQKPAEDVVVKGLSFDNPNLTFSCSEDDYNDSSEPMVIQLTDTDDDDNIYQLNKSPADADAPDSDFTWKSSNPNVVKVDASGNVTVVGFGAATVSVVYKKYPKVNATVTFTIKNADADVDDEDEDDDDYDDEDEDDEDDEDDEGDEDDDGDDDYDDYDDYEDYDDGDDWE